MTDLPTIFAILITIFWVFASLIKFFRLNWSFSWLSQGTSWKPTRPILDEDPNFLIIIPLLAEQAVAEQCLRHMATMDYPWEKYSVLFVVSSREENSLDQLSTVQVLKKAFAEQKPEPSNIAILKSSGNDSCKGDQLNEGVEYGQHHLSFKNGYVGVYDADSIPHPSIMRYIAEYCDLEQKRGNLNPEALQQIPCYFYKEQWPPRKLTQILATSRPWQNMDFALTREIPAFYRQARGELLWGAWLTHLIGHGEFIRLDTLEAMGGFRSPSADTSLGYVMSMCGVGIHPVPLFDNSENPLDVPTLIQQGATWYRGIALYWRDMRYASNIRPWKLLRAIVMLVKVIYNNLSWWLFPWLLPVSFLTLAIIGDSLRTGIFFCVGMIAYLLPVMRIMVHFKRNRQHGHVEFPNHLNSALYFITVLGNYSVLKIILSFGPILFFWRRFIGLFGFSAVYSKTSRNSG